MEIHKTFSKKDLCEICEILHIDIEDMKDLNKQQLIKQLTKWIDTHPSSLFLPNILHIDNVEEFVSHCKHINQSKISSAQTRGEVMRRAKKLIAYGKNGYILTGYGYPSVGDITEDIEFILPYGDSPSVRKAIEWINNDSKLKEKYFPQISESVLQKIRVKKELKIQSQGKAQLRWGHFVVKFE
tara:strand:+ start:9223 stop:9774 length:552 start_codon:yes stop_codon:yes gene_type:complete